MYIDFRYAIFLAINLLKYAVGMPWDWDAFHIISNLTWMKAFVHVILFLVVPFISIKVHVPLTQSKLCTTSTNTGSSSSTSTIHTEVLLKFEEISAPMAVVLMAAALVLPQALFWYVYPIIVFISSCSGELKLFAKWFHTVLTTIPVLEVIMRATIVGWQALGAQADIQNTDQETEGNRQAPAMTLGEAVIDIEAAGDEATHEVV